MKVALDAGHGSQTAGKRTPEGYREHWINVSCASLCEQALNRCNIEVFRSGWNDTISTDDADISIAARQANIKAAQCDISVSIHANAHGDGKSYTSANGIETFYHSNTSKILDSAALAKCIQNSLIQGTLQRNRGVKQQNLGMCNAYALGVRAAVLTEIGFMTNKNEAELMQNPEFLRETAEEIAHGICNYLGIEYIEPNNTNKVEQTPAVPENSKFPYRVKVTAGVLNVRKGPSILNGVITKIRQNEVYTIVDEEKEWGLLKSYASKRNGWINLKYTSKL